MFRSALSACILSACLSPAYAADWLVQDFNLDYSSGTGTASATRAQFQVKEETFNFTDASFDVRWSAGQLVIERPLDSFAYTVETDFLKDVTAATARGLNFEAVPGKITFGVTAAKLDGVKHDTAVKLTALSCLSASGAPDPVDACIDYTRFKNSGVDTDSVSIKEAEVAINKGKLSFEVDVKTIGRFKGEGTATHDAANKQVKIKVSKVKLAFLDVTGQFFKQLEDMKSDMIKVERPYIYVNYGKKEEPNP